MPLARRYDVTEVEQELEAIWRDAHVGAFAVDDRRKPVFAIDTPPPTVSGRLHLGHCYSYSHTDFVARYRRMRGDNVFYPMGFDDNGLPTERLVERVLGRRAGDVGRAAFIAHCAREGSEAVDAYAALWRRLGLSVDWRFTYRTIGRAARRASQASFLDLARRGLAYRAEAPVLWCPDCRTAIAQAELADVDRVAEMHTLLFRLDDGSQIGVATTRPELLAACVAVFVHPDDARHANLAGRTARLPLFDRSVPVLSDEGADPDKGTGAVMCCTFGDQTDVAWWRRHALPLRSLVDGDGRMTDIGGAYEGLTVAQARTRIVRDLRAAGHLATSTATAQSVRVHERCDTPVELVVARQWFIPLLERKAELLAVGATVRWHPVHMGRRYAEWVENLSWDWCISRQRTFGVPFPLWECEACGGVVLASDSQLPVDPEHDAAPEPCPCGAGRLVAPEDVLDTWATSSLTPQIAGQWLEEPALYERVFPFALRPQAHEIIRTWAFYTIAKSVLHFGARPWADVMISGWGLAPEGTGKISKSRGGGPMSPDAMMDKYSADAVRYWAASTGPGKDAVIDEEKVAQGAKLVTKLWNAFRFGERFLGLGPTDASTALSPADRWILARTSQVVAGATEHLDAYDYASAKSAVEVFFWRDLTDNYLEMAKGRLYDVDAPLRPGALFALERSLRTTLALFAPFLPYVTDAIYRALFAAREGRASIHLTEWPVAGSWAGDRHACEMGEMLVEIATRVRRYKSENALSLGSELSLLVLRSPRPGRREALRAAAADLQSVTRATGVEVRALDGADSSAAARSRDAIVSLGEVSDVEVALVP